MRAGDHGFKSHDRPKLDGVAVVHDLVGGDQGIAADHDHALGNHVEVSQHVLHPAAEVHGLQREALAPQVLLEAHIPLTAKLGPEVGIAEAWKKQLIKVRRAKPRGKSAFELGAGPGNQVRE